eukprot:SAG22_NODE_3068_length_1967_cov_42.783726_2_plen_213_part_00
MPWLPQSHGRLVDTPASGVDFLPTILELAGLPPPPPLQRVDGVSLVPLLTGGGGGLAARSLFWHCPHYGNQGGEPSSFVTRGHLKLILYHETMTVELYDIVADPAERTDLLLRPSGGGPSGGDRSGGTNSSYAAAAAGLRRELDHHLAETGAKFATPDPEFSEPERAEVWACRLAGMAATMEPQHAEFLAADYSPGTEPDWWGSVSTARPRM